LGRRKWQILVSTFLSETTLYWSLPRVLKLFLIENCRN
jgi:hypothetical protein